MQPNAFVTCNIFLDVTENVSSHKKSGFMSYINLLIARQKRIRFPFDFQNKMKENENSLECHRVEWKTIVRIKK